MENLHAFRVSRQNTENTNLNHLWICMILLFDLPLYLLSTKYIHLETCVCCPRWQHTTATTSRGLLLVSQIPLHTHTYFFIINFIGDNVIVTETLSLSGRFTFTYKTFNFQLGGYHSRNTTEILGGGSSFSLLAPRVQHCSIQVLWWPANDEDQQDDDQQTIKILKNQL